MYANPSLIHVVHDSISGWHHVFSDQGDIYSIVNISRDAAGKYTCTAWNRVGGQEKAIAVVTVHCELIFSYVQVFICYVN